MFTALDIALDIDDGAWADIPQQPDAPGPDGLTQNFRIMERVAGVPRGTEHGNPVVFVYAALGDGTPVIFQTTWSLWWAATVALRARYGEPE